MGIKTVVKNLVNLPNRLYNIIVLKYRGVKVGQDLDINGKIFCVTNCKDAIEIGNNVRINSCLASNPIGGDTRTILFSKGDAHISIGDNTGISNSAIFACNNIAIGKNVLMGGGTKIYDTDFHWLDYKRRINEPGGGKQHLFG